jgi:hypothetical protein
VGDAAAFTKQLPGAGFDKFDVIPAADLDLSSTDLRRKPVAARGGIRPVAYYGVPMPGGTQMASADARAKGLLDQAVKAKGGLARLQRIKTVKVEGTMTYATAGRPVTFPFAHYIEYPLRFRADADGPGGKMTQVFADGRFWVNDGGDVKELSADDAGPIRAAIDRDIVRLLIGAATGKFTAATTDVAGDDPLVGALEISGGGISAVTLFINRDNGLIEMARYDAGASGRGTETYSDYRNVDGIQVPFHTVLRRGSLSPIERDVKTIRFNVPLDAALFVKPG